MSTRKRRWSSEFKQAAVARMETAETIGGLASELGIYRGLLFKWRGAFEAGGGAAGTVQSVGGLGRHRQLLRWFAPRIEQMAKSGSERAIVDRATNLKNGISATP